MHNGGIDDRVGSVGRAGSDGRSDDTIDDSPPRLDELVAALEVVVVAVVVDFAFVEDAPAPDAPRATTPSDSEAHKSEAVTTR